MANESVTLETNTALPNSSVPNVTAVSDFVDDHPQELVKSVLAGLLISGGLGVIGNTVVIAVIFSSTSMHLKVTNIYIINQSFLDLAASLMLLATAIVNWAFKLTSAKLKGISGQLFCRLFENEAFLWGLFFASTINLMALAVERYCAILQPAIHQTRFTTTKVVISCVGIWVFCLAHQLAVYVPTTVKMGKMCLLGAIWPNEGTHYFVAIYTFLFQFVLPLIIMVYCYGRIALRLRQKKVSPFSGGYQESVMSIRAKRNTLKTLVVVTACFFFCWVWNQILFVCFGLGLVSVQALIDPFGYFTRIMVILNCCVNPFIYAANYQEFQRGVKRLFCPGKLTIEDTSSRFDTDLGQGSSNQISSTTVT